MTGLRAELPRAAAERDAPQAAQAAAAQAKPGRVPAVPKANKPEPEPARW